MFGLSAFFLVEVASVRAWFLYLANSSICMYLDALLSSSSMLDVDFLHRLFTKGPSPSVIMRWCMETVESKFRIFNAIFPKCSLNVRSDSLLYCQILTKAINARWRGRLVLNCIPNRVANISKESTLLGGRWVNHWRAWPFREVWNSQHNTTSFVVYKLTCVMYTSRCLSGSVVPSYFSMLRFFQLEGRVASMMLNMKWFLNYCNCLPNIFTGCGCGLVAHKLWWPLKFDTPSTLPLLPQVGHLEVSVVVGLSQLWVLLPKGDDFFNMMPMHFWHFGLEYPDHGG